MDANTIASYLKQAVPTFEGVEVAGPGVAYHYTVHADAIESLGRFLGAPLTPDLDRTQNTTAPNVARSDPGVVFAYDDLSEAAEEGDAARYVYGREAEVVEIHYSGAVRATHVQEASLGAPPTLLISTAEIIRFKRLGRCAALFEE